jgi:LPPG:FO 2-phospho-L-lactate transferase
MDGVIDVLKKSYVVAVSPIIGNAPVSGPAGKFMEARNIPATSVGVCSMYSEFLNHFVIDTLDKDLYEELKRLIEKITITKTKMKNIDDKINLAKIVMGEYL